MPLIDHYGKLAGLLNLAEDIRDSTATWEEKYDLIFGPLVSRRVAEITRLEYCDPDTSYEEDVRAYVQALEEKVKALGSLVTW